MFRRNDCIVDIRAVKHMAVSNLVANYTNGVNFNLKNVFANLIIA